MQGLAGAETDRLRLDPWDHEMHSPALVRMNADPEVVRYVGGVPLTPAQSEEMSARLEAHWYAHGYGLWAMHLKESGAMVGFVGLSHPLWWPEMIERVEVGWRLARDAWGFGFATEGARAAVRAGCEVLGLEELVSFVHPGNTRSLAVTARLGMVEEAEVPHPSRDERIRIMRMTCSSS
jgi:RimJ/RimL family protein N-acetyltransferase